VRNLDELRGGVIQMLEEETQELEARLAAEMKRVELLEAELVDARAAGDGVVSGGEEEDGKDEGGGMKDEVAPGRSLACPGKDKPVRGNGDVRLRRLDKEAAVGRMVELMRAGFSDADVLGGEYLSEAGRERAWPVHMLRVSFEAARKRVGEQEATAMMVERKARPVGWWKSAVLFGADKADAIERMKAGESAVELAKREWALANGERVRLPVGFFIGLWKRGPGRAAEARKAGHVKDED